MLNFQREIRVHDQVNQMGGIAIEMEMLQRAQKKVHESFLHHPGEVRHMRDASLFSLFPSLIFSSLLPQGRGSGVWQACTSGCVTNTIKWGHARPRTRAHQQSMT